MGNEKRKAAGLLTQAAYQNARTHDKSTRARIKAAIVTMACWGLMPIWFADWIVKRGGLRDA